MTTRIQDMRLAIAAAVIAMGIFVLDLALPLGVAAGVPYVAVVLVAARLSEPRHILMVSVACCALVLLGFLLSPSGGVFWVVVYNRALAVFAVAVTGWVLFARVRAGHQLAESRRARATLLTNLPGAAYQRRHDDDGTILLASPGCRDVTGYTALELCTSHSWYTLIHRDDRDRDYDRRR